jgi:hypothetical protein
MSEHVIALDPGGRSGWASAKMDVDRLELTGSGVLRQDLMARWLARQQGVGNLAYVQARDTLGPKFQVIVNEGWRPRRQNGSMDWIEGDPLLSSQHVGQIRLIADLSLTQYVEQAPSQKDVYRASFPEALRSLDDLSSELHDQDARLHLWGYFFTNWFTGTVDPEHTIHE